MNAPRILLIEDEAGLQLTIGDRLASEGYAVSVEGRGDTGYARALQGGFEAILLDVMLPGKSGFDIARDLRAQRVTTPILMLTARGEVMDRVLGLRLGADDYLPKPFEMMELLARLEALLRRSRPAALEPLGETAAFDDVVVDFRSVTVTRSGLEVAFTAKEYALLACFLQHRGELLSRPRLLDEVWGIEADVSTRTVDVHVASLRQKLEVNPDTPQRIVTVRGMGYRFQA